MAAVNNVVRYILGVLLLVVALNAFGGGIYGLTGAKDVPREWLDGTLFNSYVVPSLILLVVVGGSCLISAMSVFRGKPGAKRSALLSGAIILFWILVQLGIIGYTSWLQPAIGITGIVIVILTMAYEPYQARKRRLF